MPNNNDSLPTHPQSQVLQKKANDFITKFGDAASFSQIFSPMKTSEYSYYPSRCVNGTAPTVYDLDLAYGKPFPTQWLMTHIVALSEYSGAKQKVTEYQLRKLADILRSEFGYLKTTEFMLFFHYIATGKLGRLEYGTFDPIRVTEMMYEFLPVRARYIEQYEQEQRQKELEAHNRRAVHGSPEEIRRRIAEVADNLNINKPKDNN